MNDSQKKEIQMLLKTFVERYPSQAKAVGALKNVSEATVINIRKGEWESISDDMWRNVGKQVGFNNKSKWQFVPTQAASLQIDLLDDAREYGNVYAFTVNSGSGKTFVAEYFEQKRNNVYLISCSEYMNRKTFLQQILEKMGKTNTGLNVPEMMDLIIETSLKKENLLLILDEFDKVSDSILYFFITLYNKLEGNMGIVMMATSHLAKRITNGRRKNKKGYAEIFSRIGRKFIDLPAATEKEVFEIARANGISDPQYLHSIYNECEGDLRRAKRSIHKYSMKVMKKAA
jgi:hypothetical protein